MTVDHEIQGDKHLQIHTVGRDDESADEYRYPYEPTPYRVLERLVKSGLFSDDDAVVDYGCGKGRVSFFLADRTGSRVLGIEYDPRIWADAIANRQTARSRDKTEFVNVGAEQYDLPPKVNRCYFFNPFSVEILRGVMGKILASYYQSPREILLFFYYPSDEFICYLMTEDELDFYDEIDCDDLFDVFDPRERIMVFKLPDWRKT